MARTGTTKQRKTGARGKPSSGHRRGRRGFLRRNKVFVWLVIAVAALALIRIGTRGRNRGPSSEPFTGGDLHSLVVDPGNPSRLFVGGHQAVAVSTDGGRTWRQVESLRDADAMAWAFLGETILVGGHPGLSTSTDGGRTFKRTNDGLPATDIHGLGGRAGAIYAASPAIGVFASQGAAGPWEVRTPSAGQMFMGRILVDPGDAEHLLAPDMRSGVVESVDGGRSWRRLGGVGGAMWVSWDPTNTAHLIAMGPEEAAVSRDGGKTWERFPAPEGASLVEISPADASVIYAAAHEGASGRVRIQVSRDGGETWTRP